MKKPTSIIALLGLLLLPGSAVARNADPPNILFIYADDLAAWALGNSRLPGTHTPVLDRLASQGAVFDNAFVTTPVCSPSRATLLTGRQGSEVGVTDWINANPKSRRITPEMDIGLEPRGATWPERLAAAGYETALIGKWHLGVDDRFHPERFGYQTFIGFRDGGVAPRDPRIEVDGQEVVVEGFADDVLTDFADRHLRSRSGAKPFLLSLHYRAPHRPWLPVAESDLAHYAEWQLPTRLASYPDLDAERVQQGARQYLANVTALDRNVGRVLEALEESGLSDRTVVVFTSDHGFNLGHHGLVDKGNGVWATNAVRGFSTAQAVRPNMFDTSIRVPCIVRWPGVVEPGTSVERTLTNLDWHPTLLAIAGLLPSGATTLRGRNAVPLLRGEPVDWDDTFYGEYAIHHYTRADLRMLRTPRIKLVRDAMHPERDELYDLRLDPGESRNRIADPGYRSILADADAQLETRRRELVGPAPPR